MFGTLKHDEISRYGGGKKWAVQLIRELPKGTIFGYPKVRDYLDRPRFLNPKGKFSPLPLSTDLPWLFNSKKEAKNYCSDGYKWGCLINYVEIVPVFEDFAFRIRALKHHKNEKR